MPRARSRSALNSSGQVAPLWSMPWVPGGSPRPRARPSPGSTAISSRAKRTPRTRRSDRIPVAIIGGGFSGTIIAAQLARRGIASALIDGSGRAGKGVAYSTTEPAHLLNVRAEGMSAWAGEPDHFAERFEAEGGDRRGFAQRRLFARYLGDILDEAIAGGVDVVDGAATKATRVDGGWRIAFDDGQMLDAEALVLALGNHEPESLAAFTGAGARYIRNPWGADARAAVEDLAASG